VTSDLSDLRDINLMYMHELNRALVDAQRTFNDGTMIRANKKSRAARNDRRFLKLKTKYARARRIRIGINVTIFFKFSFFYEILKNSIANETYAKGYYND